MQTAQFSSKMSVAVDVVSPLGSRHRHDSDLLECSQRARDAWSRALASPELEAVGRALAGAAIAADECVHESTTITEAPRTRRRLAAIRDAIAHPVAELPRGSFERFVLAHAVLRSAEKLESATVAPAVKRLAWSGLQRFADDRTALDLSDNRFVALCKIATVRRFPAGQFDWEPSGLPRSWVGRIRPLPALVRVLSMVTLEWRAFRPAFFIHLAVTYPVRALLEREALKSYYRMARSMALQPDVHGVIASSWLHSPDTFAISPHLAWLNKVFAENGALIATMGPAEPDCGVLAQSVERQRAFAEGRFKPTLGLIVWPRRNVLAWAAAHPELDR
jgi:hypothetical protein